MEEIKELIDVINRLLAPDGCPWDREQTLLSMRNSLLEETCEVIEAIDLNDPNLIEEELGDLFFNVYFLCCLAQKEEKTTISNILKGITTKLIRRHPHIFGSAKIENSDEVLEQWEKIKKTEQSRSSLLDGIPKNLPALSRAQKILKKIKKTSFKPASEEMDTNQNEEALGAHLFDLVSKSVEKGLDPEHALKRYLANLESQFKEWEEKQNKSS